MRRKLSSTLGAFFFFFFGNTKPDVFLVNIASEFFLTLRGRPYKMISEKYLCSKGYDSVI